MLSYDGLERLTSQATTVGANRTLSFGYDGFGNLTSKTSNVSGDLNATAFGYGSAGKPHRLTSVTIAGIGNSLYYDNDGNITRYDAASGNDTFFTYDGQNNVTSITVGASAGTAVPYARDEFWYDPDGERFMRRQSWDVSGTQKSNLTVYLDDYEEFVPETGNAYSLVQRTQLTDTVQYIRVTSPGGAVNGWWDYDYHDLLGSLDAIADGSGNLVNKTSFDAFGGLREKTWSGDISSTEKNALLTSEAIRYYRGFTGHEQLNRTGFVHMNGRVFDPRIGRFVSADPYVQAPFNSQSGVGLGVAPFPQTVLRLAPKPIESNPDMTRSDRVRGARSSAI